MAPLPPPGYVCYYPPPTEFSRLWRSRKRLKKFNKLNLAAMFLHHVVALLLRIGRLGSSVYNARAQQWISANEAHPKFYLTRYIQYMNMCCDTKL